MKEEHAKQRYCPFTLPQGRSSGLPKECFTITCMAWKGTPEEGECVRLTDTSLSLKEFRAGVEEIIEGATTAARRYS
jgi:hypothetical protein